MIKNDKCNRIKTVNKQQCFLFKFKIHNIIFYIQVAERKQSKNKIFHIGNYLFINQTRTRSFIFIIFHQYKSMCLITSSYNSFTTSVANKKSA